MHTLNKLSACILTGTLILSGMTSTVKADENMIYTDHHTYYIGNVEYNEDGTIVDASHVCNMQVETPPTTDGNDTEVTPDPEPSEPTEPVTPAPTPEPQPPKVDGGTTNKPETSTVCVESSRVDFKRILVTPEALSPKTSSTW